MVPAPPTVTSSSGEPIVLVEEQGVTQLKFLGIYLVEGYRPLAFTLWKVAAGADLFVQVGHLRHVHAVLEQDDVSGVEADGPVAGSFSKTFRTRCMREVA